MILNVWLKIRNFESTVRWNDVVRTILRFLGFSIIERCPISKRESIWARGSASQSFDTFRTLSTVNSGNFLARETAESVARSDRDFVRSCFFHSHFFVTLFLVHLPFFIDHWWTKAKVIKRVDTKNCAPVTKNCDSKLLFHISSCRRKKITHCQSISVTFHRRHWQIRFLYPRFGVLLIEVSNGLLERYLPRSKNYDLALTYRVGLNRLAGQYTQPGR